MELTLDQALKKGIEAHKAGKAQEADRYYTAILKAQPKHPDANHNMGVLAVGIGKVQEALPFFKTALEVNPGIAQFWLSYIEALIKLNRMDDAKAVFNQAKIKGVKGDGFEQIEKRLIGLEKGIEVNANSSKSQEPSKEQLQNLINLYTQGLFQKTLSQGSQLLKDFPNSDNLYNIIGAANIGLGKLNEAIETYKKALLLKPDNAAAFNNLGNALKDQGKLDEAIEAYNKALSIKPDLAEAYYNMGNALKDHGKLDEAIEAYNKTLSLQPNYAEAYYNMGIALQDQGKLEQAIEAYNKIISIKPDYAEAYNNMGNALKDQGKPGEAIEAYNKALSINPDNAQAYYNMGISLLDFIFKNPNRDLQNTISSLLDQKLYVRPMEIAKAAISLLKFEPALQKELKLVSGDKVIQDPLNIISDLDELPLLRKLMSICPLPDLELEKLLKQLRASILANISSFKEASPELLRFQSALALQCFTNEYIYNQTKKEEKAINVLEKQIKELLSNNEQPSAQVILTLASYKALHKYDWCQSLIVTNQIQDVFTRQVEEPNQEEKIKLNIPILEEINNKVSSNVREQYEESPYPRWVNLGLDLEPVPISKVVDEVQLNLHCEKIKEAKNPDILIAGCGTGQHSITTAARFKSSKVLAIDLSLSSLAYAQRKTEELSIENIEYMQADILDLGKLNKQFDIIESMGVLHHMDNPTKGWKVLTDCLKPGGLMKIGLYSELARKPHIKIRNEISQQDIGKSDAAMKDFRDLIIRSNKDHHKLIRSRLDFYSLSSLKDLLFHVQEHRFTIPLIKDHLNKLGLKFCGFESSKIVPHFKLTSNHKEDPYDLDKWKVYEEANPRVFAGMYQFWCQKDL